MDNSLVAVVMAAACIGVVYVMMRAVIRDLNSSRREKQLEVELQSRSPLEDDAYHFESFADGDVPKSIAVDVRKLIGEALGMPPQILRADDDYSALAFIVGADLDDESALIEKLEAHFGIEFTDEELKACSPVVRDVARLVANRKKSM